MTSDIEKETRQMIHEANMLLASVASHGTAALTAGVNGLYAADLLRRLRDALEGVTARRFGLVAGGLRKDIDLPELLEVAKAATRGPWRKGSARLEDGVREVPYIVASGDSAHVCEVYSRLAAEDAAHIEAFAPPTAITLVGRLQAAEKVIADAGRECYAVGTTEGDVLAILSSNQQKGTSRE